MRFGLAVFVMAMVIGVLMSAGAAREAWLTIDEVMTPEELHSTGVAGLSSPQRKELDQWLNRYTATLRVSDRKKSADCDPAIETQIDGDFKGWEGSTIYELQNGQIWQQSSYHYHYHYAYAPKVTIYESGASCSLLVSDDDDQPISVRRLK